MEPGSPAAYRDRIQSTRRRGPPWVAGESGDREKATAALLVVGMSVEEVGRPGARDGGRSTGQTDAVEEVSGHVTLGDHGDEPQAAAAGTAEGIYIVDPSQ